MDDSAASDPFFLDWGSSVNVNEDLRRTIQNEINEIENDISSLQNNVKAEEKVSHQLTKDFSHARAELMNLSRGATDDRDNSTMNEQIQLRLQESLLTEVVSVITPPASPDDKSISSVADDEMPSPITRITPQDQSPSSEGDEYSSERHLGKYLSKCAAKVKLITTSMKEKKSNLEEYESQLSSLQFEIDTLVNQISREQKTQSTWNDDVDEKKREHDAEQKRLRSVKDAIQRSNKLNGQYAQRLANDSKMQLTNEAKNRVIESKFENDKQKIEQSVQQSKVDYTKLIEKDIELTNQQQSLNRQFEEREDILSQRQAIRNALQEKQRDITDLKMKEEELVKQLAEVQESFNVKKKHLDGSKKQIMEMDEMRIANDEYEEKILEPSKNMYPELLEKKQTLAKSITDLHDHALEGKHELDKRKQANDIVLNNLNADFTEKLEIVQSKKKDIAQLESRIDECLVSARNETEERKKLIMNLSEATLAQKIQNDEVLKQREEVKSTHVKWSKQLDSNRFEIEVLMAGTDIILATKDEEDELYRSTKSELKAIRMKATD